MCEALFFLGDISHHFRLLHSAAFYDYLLFIFVEIFKSARVQILPFACLCCMPPLPDPCLLLLLFLLLLFYYPFAGTFL